MRIYVASSWRNDYQPAVVRDLRAAGHEVYDFKNPKDGDHGFHWKDVLLDRNEQGLCLPVDLQRALKHPRAVEGFASDHGAVGDEIHGGSMTHENREGPDPRCPCGSRHAMIVDDAYAPGVRLYVCPDRPQYAFGRWEDREAVQRAIDAKGQLYALVTLSPDEPDPPIPTVAA